MNLAGGNTLASPVEGHGGPIPTTSDIFNDCEIQPELSNLVSFRSTLAN
jgi:hypothetical protein